MDQILLTTIIVSGLHALIPNHSLPILAVGKRYEWSVLKMSMVTILAALAHILSTIAIGLVIAYAGVNLHQELSIVFRVFTPLILILMGIYFLWQHHIHNHFHLDQVKGKEKSQLKIILWIVTAMFFAPCLEIEAVFFAASNFGWQSIITVALVFGGSTILGMLFWILIGAKLFGKFDSHRLEHNIGIITGVTLILTGLLFYFWN
jgi:hypothetical protein